MCLVQMVTVARMGRMMRAVMVMIMWPGIFVPGKGMMSRTGWLYEIFPSSLLFLMGLVFFLLG